MQNFLKKKLKKSNKKGLGEETLNLFYRKLLIVSTQAITLASG